MYRTPERGMSTYPPSTPKGLANGTDASSEERGEPPRCILHQHHSDCEENHKKKVITLFDFVFADQSKQDTTSDILPAQLLAFV